WLRGELAARARQLQGGKPADRTEARQNLRHWQRDPHLAGVRDKAALARLPGAERAGWRKFWADVEALLPAGEENQGKEAVSLSPPGWKEMPAMSTVPTRQTPPPEPAESTEEKFRRLAAVWLAQTAYVSSSGDLVAHPAFQEIVGMGPAVI